MGWFHPASLLLVVLIVLLVWAGVEDVRHRTIANGKNATIALLAPFWWWATATLGWGDLAWQIGGALAVFAAFAGLFAMGWMGGGDVKLIGALALWLPVGTMVWVLMVMSLLGGAISLALLIERGLARHQAQIEVPYGVAIVCAALLALP
ncbi:prepilin peptidase CpaA [Sphingomonas gellani]|uniref:Prepilin peptidase CpaA n=1 Tax=Sphingomonas gellani TaxID=1166340 RepID=A0A1H7YUB2_9SPHN|nr:prepilin peptidase [Sphingomonas gellani]SEM49796.1 prepilin peptidase CpaA [Sphingomonas gellani]